ncbi:glycerol-3-phosphate 1-O-acyltransferase PlsY [Alicyclobacillus tolerans]|uniref:glycerol-3-phosphate 1-O-acyltransferase PlsY n=1 Tax=Alicyclobacillus tolerans TaxID=90970 RepID=UPI001F001AD3|nr:glycerol-3-phosphate 1-O-acyltransferase PlsY [Alicyclobacillus tolerans]MCF8563728.1 glycerol-3-phosphate 1-O-acyltransferase PlsY [Alicyclobacillus tolerans]
MLTIVSVVLAYLIGSISSSTIVGKWFKKMDIRDHGSGNAGATNTLRVLGWKWAVVVLAADILKGIVAILLAWHFGHGSVWTTYLSGLAVIAGHNWPLYFGFRGGKGIATTIGVLVLVMFVPALLAGIIAIALVVVTRYVSLGALTFTILTPVFVILLQHHVGAAVFAAIVALFSIYRHRANIGRLIRGEEHRVFSK